MPNIGYISLVVALAASIYGIIAFVLGAVKKNEGTVKSGKVAVLAVAVFSSVATLVLLYYLMSGDYSIKYVYEYTSSDLPVFYRFSAWWAGNAGSLMLWLFLLVWYSVAVAYSKKAKELTPIASGILLFNSAFFLLVLVFLANPFERVSTIGDMSPNRLA